MPRVWQTIYPVGNAETSMRQVSRQLRAFERLAPEFRGLHPLAATSPQECSEITAHMFRSLRFDTTYRIPSYRRWLDADGHLPAYRFEKRFLQHLQHLQGGSRWVLKIPDHLFALTELRAVFPDARMVFVHRDPLNVLLSVARLTEVLRRPFTRQLDPREIGRQESARWLDGTARMIRAAIENRSQTRSATLPISIWSATRWGRWTCYRHFGMELDATTAGRVAQTVAVRPDGGYGHRPYRFQDHGLDEAAEREKFAGYMRHFGIDAETRRTQPTLSAPTLL